MTSVSFYHCSRRSCRDG